MGYEIKSFEAERIKLNSDERSVHLTFRNTCDRSEISGWITMEKFLKLDPSLVYFISQVIEILDLK
jgi:hypothetical protein